MTKGFHQRKLLCCANPDCRRKAIHLGGGIASQNCLEHGTTKERTAYLEAWRSQLEA
jgi:hypothetical protein